MIPTISKNDNLRDEKNEKKIGSSFRRSHKCSTKGHGFPGILAPQKPDPAPWNSAPAEAGNGVREGGLQNGVMMGRLMAVSGQNAMEGGAPTGGGGDDGLLEGELRKARLHQEAGAGVWGALGGGGSGRDPSGEGRGDPSLLQGERGISRGNQN